VLHRSISDEAEKDEVFLGYKLALNVNWTLHSVSPLVHMFHLSAGYAIKTLIIVSGQLAGGWKHSKQGSICGQVAAAAELISMQQPYILPMCILANE